jgi:Schlafen, AlbA_2
MSLIDRFVSMSIKDIEQFVQSKQEETLHLEFKTISRPDFSMRDDKRNLAVALSGFANSDGGLIVWGVDARKNKDGIDCAEKLVEINGVATFTSRLNELTGEAVLPRIDGIQHRCIARPDGNGFALTLVPSSETGPHMAKLGEDRYFKRSGTSFYRMEHFDVADMFGRRRRAKLSVTTRVVAKGASAKIVLGLRNDGRSGARAPFLAFDAPLPFGRDEYGLDGNRNEGMHRLPFAGQGLPFRYGENTNFVIHPGIVLEVASISLGFTPRGFPSENIRINFAICAEDVPLEEGSAEVPLHQIL